MRHERSGNTFQPTALIHEAYLQLVRQDLPDFESRAHFFGVAAHVMRQLLIAGARCRRDTLTPNLLGRGIIRCHREKIRRC